MKKSRVLTDKQKTAANRIADGEPPTKVCQEVYNSNDLRHVRTQQVQEHIKQAREVVKDATTLNRLDIIEGVLEAIDMARLQSEPATMIAGYDKLAKIIGAYAPEVKQLQLTTSQEAIRSKFDSMSSEELLAIIDGKAIYNGHATRLS